MATVQLESEVIIRSAKLSLLKSLGAMTKSDMPLTTSCLTAAAIAARILQTHELPFRVVAGYLHMPGVEWSMPHVWLESGPDNLITDITYSDSGRRVMVLGQGFAFDEPSERGTYETEARFPIPGSSIPVSILSQHAADLDGYLLKGSPKLQAAVQKVLTKALDGTDTIEF